MSDDDLDADLEGDDEGNSLGNVGNDVDDLDDMAGNRVDDMVGNRVDGGRSRAVLDYIARSLASEPDAVVVETDRVPAAACASASTWPRATWAG